MIRVLWEVKLDGLKIIISAIIKGIDYNFGWCTRTRIRVGSIKHIYVIVTDEVQPIILGLIKF